jgi:hypothetical protein
MSQVKSTTLNYSLFETKRILLITIKSAGSKGLKKKND